jgi:pimeloyl-ACP methyl ester carboxylesterase
VIKEIEDIEALIDTAGGSAYLYGISSGAALALEAAIKLPNKVKKLALYEAPYDSSEAGVALWRNYRAKLAELLAVDNRSGAIRLFLRFVGVPSEMIETMHSSPAWQPMKAIAPTLAYDAAVLGNNRTVPTHLAAKVMAPTLVIDGSVTQQTMPFMRVSAEALTAAIQNARHQILEGQRHDVDNKVLAPVLAAFFKETK